MMGATIALLPSPSMGEGPGMGVTPAPASSLRGWRRRVSFEVTPTPNRPTRSYTSAKDPIEGKGLSRADPQRLAYTSQAPTTWCAAFR
jgi:hypothetical protein